MASPADRVAASQRLTRLVLEARAFDRRRKHGASIGERNHAARVCRIERELAKITRCGGCGEWVYAGRECVPCAIIDLATSR